MNMYGNSSSRSGPGESSVGWGMSGIPDANMMMQQIMQLQNSVRQLQSSAGQARGTDECYGSGRECGGVSWEHDCNIGPFYGKNRTWRNEVSYDEKDEESVPNIQQKVLLVSNIPPYLANPDSLYYAFEKFGTVERVKILLNKRNTAFIQMSQPKEAMKAVNEQDQLNRFGSDIYVNYSNKFKEIMFPDPRSRDHDELTKDYTEQQTKQQHMGEDHGMLRRGADMFNMMSKIRGRGMYAMGSLGGKNMMGPQNFEFDSFTPYQQGGVVLLVSNIPDQIAKVENIFNMIGMYGDVIAVKILRNKRDCCLVQMAKPHHAHQVRIYLDQAKVGGNKLCISNSRVENLLIKRIEEDNELQRDFSNSRNHRYRNNVMAAKLIRNLGPPSSTLHVANLPPELNHTEVKGLFTEAGFTVKESEECGATGNMALLSMASPDEALLALAVMHNYAPEPYKFKNSAGLCVSFSLRK